jgi:hypothetical protein
MNVIAVLRGLVLNPLLVAFARGLLEAAGMAALLVASDYVASDALPDEYKMYVPLVQLGFRMVEGAWDKVDPAKQRRRDELRDAASLAKVNDSLTSINRGDVVE